MLVKVISFYTEGSYREYASVLMQSCFRYEVPYEVVLETKSTTWAEAVSYKPEFIRKMLHGISGWDGVLWTDADSEFASRPDFSVFSQCDMAWHRFSRTKESNPEWLTGTMWFRKIPAVLTFLSEWAKRMESPKYAEVFTPEQAAFRDEWSDKPYDWSIRTMDLSPEWVWIHDDFPKIYGERKPVIVHKQASRMHRGTILTR